MFTYQISIVKVIHTLVVTFRAATIVSWNWCASILSTDFCIKARARYVAAHYLMETAGFIDIVGAVAVCTRVRKPGFAGLEKVKSKMH